LHIIDSDRILTEIRGGAQGFVFLVEHIKTKEKYVLKQVFIDEAKKAEIEKVVLIWKLLCESPAKDYFVKYIDHFFLKVEVQVCILLKV
jgi:hypothetical protein